MIETKYIWAEKTADVKVWSDESLLLSELSNICHDKGIAAELGKEVSREFVTVFNVTEAQFDELFQEARASVDNLYQQAMQADAESEFPNW